MKKRVKNIAKKRAEKGKKRAEKFADKEKSRTFAPVKQTMTQRGVAQPG